MPRIRQTPLFIFETMHRWIGQKTRVSRAGVLADCFERHRDTRSSVKPSVAVLESLEKRLQLDGNGLTAAAAPSTMPVAMWIERDNGDAPYYDGIVNYATTVEPLTAKKLLLRLADPESPDPSISSNFQLDPSSNLIRSILALDSKGFTGQVAIFPDFTSKKPWHWNPLNVTDSNKWESAFYWAQQANSILTSKGSKLLISEVTIESQSSGIPADSSTLTAIRAYEKQLWPSMHADPSFVGSGMAHGFTNLTQMAGWTQGTPDARLLDAAYCELYNMTKMDGTTTYVDAYAAWANVQNPVPAAPDTIYSMARNAEDPVAQVLGTPSADVPASTFGYLVGAYSSSGMPADLSRTWLILSAEKIGVGESSIDAFGTWDAPQAGPGAGVDEFQAFCSSLISEFMPFWGSTVAPNICVFQYEDLPYTWVNNDLGQTPAPPTSFDQWQFPIWDYRECATDDTTLANYHQWLLGYVQDHPPAKLILYVTDPQLAGGSFYDPTAAPATGASTNFIGFLNQVAGLKHRVPIEIMFDRSSFASTGPSSVPANWAPLAPAAPSPIVLPGDWTGLPRGFSWLTTLLGNPNLSPGTITGLTIDPELSKNYPGPNTGSVAYENVACWLDWAKRLSPISAQLGIGMALEVDAQLFAKANTTTFPATGDLAGLIKPGVLALGNYLVNGFPSWRPGVADPILSMAYMEAYVGGLASSGQPAAGNYFRWMNNDTPTPTPRTPAQAAADLQSSLLDIPYAAGMGTITVNGPTSKLIINGTGTNFDQLEQYTAISTLDSSGSMDPATAPFWKIQGIKPGGTTLSATGPAADITSPRNWLFTELPMDWQAPTVPAGLENRITFMFSAEHTPNTPFFGYWQLPDFLQFMTTASGLLGSTNPNSAIFTDGKNGYGVPLSNYGLYSLKQVCQAWNIATYPGTADVIAPAPPSVKLTVDSGASSTDGLTNNPALTVTGEPNARFEYSLDSGLHWLPGFRATQGLNALLVHQIDTAGNVSQPTAFQFTLDQRRPAKLNVSLAGDSGLSRTDQVTRFAQLSLSNTESDATFQYRTPGKAWSPFFTPVEGLNNVIVRQIDKAGNISLASRPFRFWLDTTAAAPSVNVQNSAAGPRLQVSGLEQGSIVQYSSNGGNSWKRRFKPQPGTNTVSVQQIDRAGNVSPATTVSFMNGAGASVRQIRQRSHKVH